MHRTEEYQVFSSLSHDAVFAYRIRRGSNSLGWINRLSNIQNTEIDILLKLSEKSTLRGKCSVACTVCVCIFECFIRYKRILYGNYFRSRAILFFINVLIL